MLFFMFFLFNSFIFPISSIDIGLSYLDGLVSSQLKEMVRYTYGSYLDQMGHITIDLLDKQQKYFDKGKEFLFLNETELEEILNGWSYGIKETQKNFKELATDECDDDDDDDYENDDEKIREKSKYFDKYTETMGSVTENFVTYYIKILEINSKN